MNRLLLGLLLTAGVAAAHEEPDLTRLPLGDGKISTEAKAGFIWACRIDPNGRGADVNGPWIHDDGTYDLTSKVAVQGSVRWPQRFTIRKDGDKRVFEANDYPDHPTGSFPISPDDPAYAYDRNPNGLREQSMRLELAATPKLARAPSCAPGAVGILLSGSVLFNALDAPGRDAVAHETQDACQGHPQESGVYHYHSLSSCIEDKPGEDGHSRLMGYALDGFGIFGRKGEGGKTLTSADLDECHGHTHVIDWDGKRVKMYHYHATWDFPYTVGCFKGTYNREDVRTISGPPPGLSRRGRRGPPDLSTAADNLGIPVETLRQALGPPPPDLTAAAQRLGIPEDRLRRALDAAR